MPVVRKATAVSAWQIAGPEDAAAWTAYRRAPLLAQAGLPQSGSFIGGFAFICVSALFTCAFIYAAIRIIRLLTGYDLSEVLKGNRPLSFRWLALFVLGLVAGVLATLLAALLWWPS